MGSVGVVATAETPPSRWRRSSVGEREESQAKTDEDSMLSIIVTLSHLRQGGLHSSHHRGSTTESSCSSTLISSSGSFASASLSVSLYSENVRLRLSSSVLTAGTADKTRASSSGEVDSTLSTDSFTSVPRAASASSLSVTR